MSQLQYNEIREKRIIIHDDEPCEVVESHVARTQQRKPQNQVKLRSLISGKVFPATFHVSDSADEADIEKRDITFLYENRGEYWFCDPNDKSNRFKLDEALIGVVAKFLKQNSNATALIWTNEDDEEKIIKITLPIKMEFRVKEAPPAVRGDTSKGGNKIITLENGATLNAPMFISEGDTIRVNTETGEYVERV
ncbi:MAG: Elongation factor P [Candidatus Nomurabacteria bacterium GW2011_GWB1_40_7]|uniref:Elongation factor P n=1 Tax=Candidatus Nomurabacteria bacterium GW2011_GWB1_40_7 TaxID=1618744 RepID=A0A0G0T6U7_9BACT|nr:MAG: Elongation factor P [Candidatus Nomurabacteria bacterium GW2011_GWB1_40_7]